MSLFLLAMPLMLASCGNDTSLNNSNSSSSVTPASDTTSTGASSTKGKVANINLDTSLDWKYFLTNLD